MNFLYLSTGDLWPCYISFKLPSSNEFLSINLMVFFLFPLSNFLNFFDLVENNVSSLTLQFDGKNIHVMRKFPILPSGRPRMASPGGPKTKQDENLPIRNINLQEYGTPSWRYSKVVYFYTYYTIPKRLGLISVNWSGG